MMKQLEDMMQELGLEAPRAYFGKIREFADSRSPVLDLHSAGLTDEDIPLLVACLSAGKDWLVKLDIGRNSFSPAGLKTVAAAVARMRSLKLLYCYDNKVSVPGAALLFIDAIRALPLMTLDLRFMGINDEDIVSLVPALKDCPTLAWLALTGNSIGDDGARALGAALALLPLLESIWLDINPFGEAGAAAVAASLTGARALRVCLLPEKEAPREAALRSALCADVRSRAETTGVVHPREIVYFC